jgi:hypothetical protein
MWTRALENGVRRSPHASIMWRGASCLSNPMALGWRTRCERHHEGKEEKEGDAGNQADGIPMLVCTVARQSWFDHDDED